MNDKIAYDKLLRNLRIIDDRMTRAGHRLGLDPYRTDYDVVTDEVMSQNLVYVAMPVNYSHWRYGKQAQQSRAGHVFEVVINSDPSVCYLGLGNDITMQALVIAHAKWGHVDFFKNNRLFSETGAQDVLQRFRDNKDFIQSLVEHPDWRWEGVETYLDAAHALEHQIGWLPTLPGEREKIEQEFRESLMEELRQLKSQYEMENIDSNKASIARDIKELENRLKCHPLTPTSDILGFLADPANTQHLPKEARRILMIVREQGRYFQPQGRTKFMNEGWATLFEREVMIQPEVALPFNMHFDGAKYWAMFDRSPINWYFDPYGLGEQVWHWIDMKYGYDEEPAVVRYKDLSWDPVEGVLTEGKSWKKKTIIPRNRDKMFQVRRDYDDNRFLEEFISKEFFEHLNLQTLAWMRGNKDRIGLMEHINNQLRKTGWGPQYVFETLPETLEGLMNVVQIWMNAAQQSANWQQQIGTPAFPVHPQTLQEMAQVLQIVGAYDEDWHAMRRQLVQRTGYNSVPFIELVDTGRHTDGVWTLRHVYNPDFGPLLQSEARETLRYFRLLCGGPCRLLTMEQREDSTGRPLGDPAPFVYFTEDGDTVKEQFV
jgi:spore cortex formation protein SpoVR/YcgB (stage V sporulation)